MDAWASASACLIISFGQVAKQVDRPGHIYVYMGGLSTHKTCMYFFLGLSSWNPLFRTPANTSLVVKYFEGRSITLSPFKILIPWLQRGFCPVSYLLCGHFVPNIMAGVCWGFRFEGSTDMETSFDPTNHPSSILNKAIFDPCVLQDQKWPCLFWVRNGSNNYCSPASPRLETHGRWCARSHHRPQWRCKDAS